jgi:signal transduction histidine kinase
VEDDGVGLKDAGEMATARPGLGLLGIQERASELGGTFQLESQPGKGTRVTIELPTRHPVSRGNGSDTDDDEGSGIAGANQKRGVLDDAAHPAGR